MHSPMRRHTMKLQPAAFTRMRDGTKRVELRLWDEKRQAVQPGDTVLFIREPEQAETLEATVLALVRGDSFAQLLRALPASALGLESKDDAMRELRTHYSANDEAAHGVVALWVELV